MNRFVFKTLTTISSAVLFTCLAPFHLTAFQECSFGQDANTTVQHQRRSKTIQESAPKILQGVWDCHLVSPGGKLPFQIQFTNNSKGFLVDQKLIQIPTINYQGEELLVRFDHYDSEIKAKWDANKKAFTGVWSKRRGKKKWGRMDFVAKKSKNATANLKPEITPNMKPFFGRWAVRFSSSTDPAVFEFANLDQKKHFSTFLTTTGDYRYLRQQVDKNSHLWLSCFDGAHAFLFHCQKEKDGSLIGTFWSGNSWKESWTATKDPSAKLPNAFGQTKLVPSHDLGTLKFPNLDGKLMGLNDPSFQGKARVIYVFGSWCPNCHDAAAYLKTLHKKYQSKGLKILGLAFEMTGDFQRDSKQVKTYVERHQVSYPILVAGLADKKLASKAVPFLDKVRSYPTTIFLDRSGKVVKIHTGFTGPATGKAYEELKGQFETAIQALLKD